MPEEILIQEEIPDKLYFRIGEVATIVGVEPHVLRYWETEFRIKPHRSMSGQRLYRKQDIGRFLRIRHLLHEKGFTVAGARNFLKDEPGMTPGLSADALKDAIGRIQSVRSRISAITALAKEMES